MSYGEGSYGEASYGESPDDGLSPRISESLAFGTTLSPLSIYVPTYAESLSLVDTSTIAFTTPCRESLAFTDTTTWYLVHQLIESLNLGDTVLQDSTYNLLFSENIEFADTARVVFSELVSEALVLTDAVTFVKAWSNKLRETLVLQDSADLNLVYNQLIADALAVADLVAHRTQETLSDSLALTDTFIGLRTLYGQLVDSILAGDTASYLSLFSGSLSDSLAVADSVVGSQIFQALLQDTFQLFIWSGTDQMAYTGFVMNPKVGGLTEYQNYDFNSIAKIGSSYYGASSTGLYLLEGADDAGTDVGIRIKFGAFDPGAGKKSRVEQAYIGVRSDGKMIFKTFADDGKERWYETQALHDDLSTQRAKLGRGVKSRYWQFELVNRDGAPVELEQFEFLPIVLTRRV